MLPAPSRESVFDDESWWNPDEFLYGLHALVGPLRGPYVLTTLRNAGAVGGSCVLDIGSGGGFLAATLADAGYDVVGIDPAMSAVRSAAQHVSASFVLGAGETLPFGSDSFDVVVCSEVLEHVDDVDKVIGEVGRVLRTGGVLIFSLPNRTLLSRLALIELAQRNSVTRVLPPGLHDWERFIGSRDLTELLRHHELIVHEVHGVSVRIRDLPVAVGAMVNLRRRRISYSEAGSRVRLRFSRSRAIAYIGYAVKANRSTT
jgi:2-polyprenyl-6-hydroxyphenyl methylase/3-demethylubiquinone-9 3-methyltransferase